MQRNQPFSLIVALFLFLCASAAAQDIPPVAPIEGLSFLTGSWSGSQGTAHIEEHWSSPQGNSMMGMFRLVSSGTPIFYEFMQIERNPDGIHLRIRHFGPGMTSWESEKSPMTFCLQDCRPNRATFQRKDNGEKLVYSKRAGEELVAVLIQVQEGKSQETTYRFKRARDKKPEVLPFVSHKPAKKR